MEHLPVSSSYLDLSLIFLLFRLSFLTLFFLHFALMSQAYSEILQELSNFSNLINYSTNAQYHSLKIL